MSQVQERKKLRIAFVHPDLGIGELFFADFVSELNGQEVQRG